MIDASAHNIFLMLVNAAATVKDIQLSQQKAAAVIANVVDIDQKCLDEYVDDMESLSSMADQYVRWQYGQQERPVWISFFNGKFI